MRHPPRLTLSTLTCALILTLSACGSQSAPPTGTTGTTPAPTTPAPSTSKPLVLKDVPFVYADSSTTEVNVAAGITVVSAYESPAFTTASGTLHLFAGGKSPAPVYLTDPAGRLRAISEHLPAEAQVTFSAAETARALVQESLLIKGTGPDTKVLIKQTLDAGKYDAPLASLNANLLAGQGSVDSDENLKTAYDVAFLILKDLSAGTIRPQTILMNVRDQPGNDLLAQLNLDVSEQKGKDAAGTITTTSFSLLDKGPVTYGVRVTDGNELNEVGHGTLLSASAFTGFPIIDYILGAAFNPGHYEMKAEEYVTARTPVCRPLTVTYSATEGHGTYSSDPTQKLNFSPMEYNSLTAFSAVADAASLPEHEFTGDAETAMKVLKYTNAVAAAAVRITGNSDLSGNAEHKQPLEKISFVIGVLHELIGPTIDAFRDFAPKGDPVLDLFRSTNDGLGQRLTKAYTAWAETNKDEIEKDIKLIKVFDALTDFAKLSAVIIEIGREEAHYPLRTSHLMFDPCNPQFKMDPVAPITGRVGIGGNGTLTLYNVKPYSLLTYHVTTPLPDSLVLLDSIGTISTEESPNGVARALLFARCPSKGTRTEPITVTTNDPEHLSVTADVKITCVDDFALSVPSTVTILAPVNRVAETTFLVKSLRSSGTVNFTATGEGFENITPSTGTVSGGQPDPTPVTLSYACKGPEHRTLTVMITTESDGSTTQQPVSVDIRCVTTSPYPTPFHDAYLKVQVVKQGGGGGYIDDTHTTVYCTAFATYNATFTIDASVDNSEAHFITPGTRFNTRTFTPLTIDFRINEPTVGQCAEQIKRLIDTWVQERQAQTLSMYQARLVPDLIATDLGGSSSADLITTYSVNLTPKK